MLERPELAALIGAICCEWSYAESRLAFYYAYLLFGVFDYGVAVHSGLGIAVQTFDQVASLPQRISIIQSAAEARRFPKPIFLRFKRLLKNLRDAQEKRIIVAHGRWGLPGKNLPDLLIWERAIGTPMEAMVYNKQDFENALDRITTASRELQTFVEVEMFPLLKTVAKDYIRYATTPKDSKDGI